MNIIVARKSTNNAGAPEATAVLLALGYDVTENLTATVADCRAYSLVVLDASNWSLATLTGGDQFIKDLLADGQQVLLAGNDTDTSTFFVATESNTNWPGAGVVGRTYKTAEHPVWDGIREVLANDSDTGHHIKTLTLGAFLSGVRALGAYTNDPLGVAVVEGYHASGGRFLFVPRFATFTGSTFPAQTTRNRFLQNAVRWLTTAYREPASAAPLFFYKPGMQVPGLTFIRASTALQRRRDGIWEQVASGAVRDNHWAGGRRALLLEAERINQLENGDYETDTVGTTGINSATVSRVPCPSQIYTNSVWCLKVSASGASTDSGARFVKRSGSRLTVVDVFSPHSSHAHVYVPAASTGKSVRWVVEWYDVSAVLLRTDSQTNQTLTAVNGWQWIVYNTPGPPTGAVTAVAYLTNGSVAAAFDFYVDLAQFELTWTSNSPAIAVATTPIPTNTGTVTRAGDQWYVYFPHRPQAMAAYLHLQANGTQDLPSARPFQIGSLGNLNPRFIVHGTSLPPTPAGYSARWNVAGGTPIYKSVAATTPVYGDDVKLLATLRDDGIIQLRQKLNDGVEEVETPDVAATLPDQWSGPYLSLGSIGNNFSFGSNFAGNDPIYGVIVVACPGNVFPPMTFFSDALKDPSPTARTLYLAELKAYDPVSGQERVFRFASDNGYTTSHFARPADAYFKPRLKQPAFLHRTIVAKDATSGDTQVGYGDVVLQNDDGELDYLLSYAFDGRLITLWRGTTGSTFPFGFQKILSGTMDQPESPEDTVVIKVRDRQLELDIPFQADRYLGTNVLPNGVEGTLDIQGKLRPVLLGRVQNASPPCVNTAKQIYHVNDSIWGINNFVSIAYNPVAGLYVGVGNAPNVIATSTDGVQWRRQEANPFGVNTNNYVAYGNGLFVLVGTGGSLATSPDGISWQVRGNTTFSTSEITAVTYSETLRLWVVVGILGKLATSPDTIVWTARTSGFSTTAIRRVAYGAGLLVAVGDSGTLSTSTDGITWTTRTSGFGVGLFDVVWGVAAGLWVIVGVNGSLATSPDGITWTSHTSGFGATRIKGVGWGNAMLVAVGDGGKIATSVDGTTWTIRTSGTTLQLEQAQFGNTWVIGGLNVHLTSPDGLTYTVRRALETMFNVYDNGVALLYGFLLTLQTSSFGSSNIYAATAGNGLLLAGGDAGKLATSVDGVTWTQQASATAIFGADPVYGLAWSPTLALFVAVGNNGKIATSPDGVTWTSRTGTFGGTSVIWRVIWANGQFVAVGAATGPAAHISTSPDGINWTSRTNPFGASVIYDIAYGAGLYVAVSQTGKIATSPDAITWTLRTSSFNATDIYTIVYGGGQFVAAGYAGALATSPDGLDWTQRDSKFKLADGTPITIQAVRYDNGLYVAVGDLGTLSVSTNGVVWSLLTSAFGPTHDIRNAAAGNGVFFLVGHAGTMSTFAGPGVYDNFADLLDDTKIPAPGTYKTYLNGGYFRLGVAPAGQVTCDCQETSAEGDAGNLFRRILMRANIKNTDYFPVELTSTLQPLLPVYPLGFWTVDERSVLSVLDELVGGLGSWWSVTQDGAFRAAKLVAPSGTPVLALTANDLKSPLRRIRLNEQGNGLPRYRTTVRYNRNYTVQTQVAGNVPQDRKSFLSQEWREKSTIDAMVRLVHPLAPAVVVDSWIYSANGVDAQTEADAQQLLRGVQRDTFEAVIPLTRETAQADLAQVVSLTHKRYGLSFTKLFEVLGIAADAAGGSLTLTIWG